MPAGGRSAAHDTILETSHNSNLMRFRLMLVLAGAMLVAATWSYPFWRPLLVDDVVNEAFPGLQGALQDDFRLLSAAEQNGFPANGARGPVHGAGHGAGRVAGAGAR